MLGNLTDTEIEDLLKRQVIGRIACHADGVTYIVPTNYLYNGTHIISHSAAGKKIEMMRKNPDVCFEVEDIQSVFRWQTVIAWGKYEEITEPKERDRAMQGLIHKIMPLVSDPADHPFHGIAVDEFDIETKIELILFKITLNNKTGRFESGIHPMVGK
jgi:nitroimidazol reductase NimA-like FMN-containing flavoprotein (pyridoxamine 5'-phosphate oxidase superfamily)